jgi:hypothetical protein
MLGWLRKKSEHNVCPCGAKIEAGQKYCEKCQPVARNLVQGYLCKDSGHIFMVFCLPTRKDMSKDINDYKAIQCPVCKSENIAEQEVRRN